MKSFGLNIALVLAVVLGPGTAQTEDGSGDMHQPERLWIDLQQTDTSHWQATVSLENTSLLAALTLALRWGTGNAPFLIDSATYTDSRLEYFALKTYLVDTAQQTVLIGLISDLGMGLPPLEPGSGPIALLHFTVLTPTEKPLTLDSTFIPPHNTLQLVTPDVRAITPEFDVRRVARTVAAPAVGSKGP